MVGIAGLDNDESGVLFYFNDIHLSDDHLRFKREYCPSKVTFNLADIASDIYCDDNKSIHFSLTSGEKWVARNLSEAKEGYRIRDKHQEIDLDEFLEMVNRHDELGVIHRQSDILTNFMYDITIIEDPDGDGDREVKLILRSTWDAIARCEICLDSCSSKFYVDETRTTNDTPYAVHISLDDTPYADISILLHES